MTSDGLEVEESDHGFKWVYQSTGGACFISPKLYKTKAAARKAGRTWIAEQYPSEEE
jgi:hypothetical protein